MKKYLLGTLIALLTPSLAFAFIIHDVRTGETLQSIGETYGVDWKTIEGHEGNPDLIYPGEELLIPETLAGESFTFGAASTTIVSNLQFMGELLPDGSTCSDGQILKKTGANNWDCAADDSAAGAGSGTVTTSTAVTVNYFPLWGSASALTGTSPLYASNTRIGVGTISPSTTVDVVGDLRISASTTLLANLIFAGDTIDELVGTGLQVSSGDLQTTLGTSIGAAEIETDAVSADELNATGVEAELEAVLDIDALQGSTTDSQVPNDITVDLATAASDLTCTNCINATEIEDIYVLNSGDIVEGDLQITGLASSTQLRTPSSTISTLSLSTLIISADSITDFVGTGLTLNGSTLETTLGTAIVTGEITDGTILSGDLSFDNALADGDIVVYDSTGTNFEGLTCAEITGSADLCDGADDGAAGGGSVSTSSAITAGYHPYWATSTGGLSGSSTIFNAGDLVGVGTIFPSTTLHVVGGFTATATTTLGANLVFAGDTIDELVGTGLQLGSGDLQTTLGTSIAAAEIDTDAVSADELNATGVETELEAELDLDQLQGTLDIASGGTGATSFTAGSVIFASSTTVLGQDNADFFWENTNNRLGLGTTAPSSTLHVFGTATISSTMHLHTAGVSLSAADGILTLLGLGNGNDENLTLDFDNGSANTVVFGTGTGVTTLDMATIGFDLDSATTKLSTVTGAVDAGGATSLEVPNGAGGTTIDATGEVTVNSSTQTFGFAIGSATRWLNPETCFSPSWTIEYPSSTEDNSIMIFNATSTLTKVRAINKKAGDTVTFNLAWDSNRQTATSSAKKAFTSNQAVTATTTVSSLTVNGSTTINALDVMRFYTTAASSTQFTLDVCWRENQ